MLATIAVDKFTFQFGHAPPHLLDGLNDWNGSFVMVSQALLTVKKKKKKGVKSHPRFVFRSFACGSDHQARPGHAEAIVRELSYP